MPLIEPNRSKLHMSINDEIKAVTIVAVANKSGIYEWRALEKNEINNS